MWCSQNSMNSSHKKPQRKQSCLADHFLCAITEFRIFVWVRRSCESFASLGSAAWAVQPVRTQRHWFGGDTRMQLRLSFAFQKLTTCWFTLPWDWLLERISSWPCYLFTLLSCNAEYSGFKIRPTRLQLQAPWPIRTPCQWTPKSPSKIIKMMWTIETACHRHSTWKESCLYMILLPCQFLLRRNTAEVSFWEHIMQAQSTDIMALVCTQHVATLILFFWQKRAALWSHYYIVVVFVGVHGSPLPLPTSHQPRQAVSVVGVMALREYILNWHPHLHLSRQILLKPLHHSLSLLFCLQWIELSCLEAFTGTIFIGVLVVLGVRFALQIHVVSRDSTSRRETT